MAKDSSFDIVSTIDLQEVDNAFQQAKKELSQRYDLKDTKSSITFNKNDKLIILVAPSDFVLGQVEDIFTSKLVRRGIELSSVKWGSIDSASNAQVQKKGELIEGIEKEIASKINKDIKAQKFKAKVQIEGDHLRVSSPSRDTLQDIISFVKSNDYGQPLQFTNYR